MRNDGTKVSTSFERVGNGTEHGLTLWPRSDRENSGLSMRNPFSPSGNIRVLVRQSDDPKAPSKGSTVAHELFAHARYIILCRLGFAAVARHHDPKKGEKPNEVDRAAKRAEKEADSK